MTDRKKLISQHNLLYETAPTVWQDGFPIGNGHFGALVYQPEGIEFAISKLDVWDRRTEMPQKIPFEKVKKLAKTDPKKMFDQLDTEHPTTDSHLPAPKPCGKLSISIEDWVISPLHTIFNQQQELSLYDGIVTCEYELASKAVRCESFIHPDKNILTINVSDSWTDKRLFTSTKQNFCYEQKVTLSRVIDHDLGMPSTGCDDEVAWIEYKFPDGFEYIIAISIKGVELSKPEIYPNSIDIKAILDYKKGKRISYNIYLTVVTSIDSKTPLETAKLNLKQVSNTEYNKMRARQKNWWKKFWDKSAIELDNKFLEGIWYYSLYQFACTSRGNTAPGLFGLWNACKTVPWSGDYHGDINMAMTYWPIFSSNHIELGEPYFKTFEKLAKIAKKQTKEIYQIDGLKFQIATLDTGVELCPGHYRMIQCTTAFYGLLFWNWFIYTKNKKILKEHVFDILEEGSKFYLSLCEKDPKTGSLLIGPSWAPEQGPFPAYNTNNDLGLIKPFWQAYIDACEILSIDSDIKNKVKKCLNNFPEYPTKNGEFVDSLTADGFIGLNHPGLLSMVVPGQDVDAENIFAGIAKKTLHKYLNRTNRKSFSGRTSSSCDLTWPWLVSIATKLRDEKYAEHLLMDIGIGEALKSNGMFAFIAGDLISNKNKKRKAYSRNVPEIALHALFSLSSTKRGKELTMSMLQQGSGYIYAINEMLMQSHLNTIRIFPSVPKCIGDCAFKDLRAEGAFLVSARKVKNTTSHITIESLSGGTCKIKIYDIPDSKEIKLKTSKNGIVVAKKVAKKTWEFEAQKGMTYFWSKTGRKKDIKLKHSNISGVKQISIHKNTVSYGKKNCLFEER